MHAQDHLDQIARYALGFPASHPCASARAHTHTHTPRVAHTCAWHTHTHRVWHTRACGTRTRTHTCTHTHTNTYIHTLNTRTHAHMHSQDHLDQSARPALDYLTYQNHESFPPLIVHPVHLQNARNGTLLETPSVHDNLTHLNVIDATCAPADVDGAVTEGGGGEGPTP